MWITEVPSYRPPREVHSIYSETGERTRKHHRKSRNGCVFCRRRRIKCDELKPKCSNCLQRRQQCQYPADLETSGSSQSSDADSSQPANEARLLGALTEGQVLQVLASVDHHDPDLADFSPAVRLYALESLKHFVQCDQSWLKARNVQTIMQTTAVGLVMDHTHLLHAVLALSAAHLATLRPNSQSYWTSSMIHWQHSLRAYSVCFNDSLETQNIDALWFSSQLQGMLAFLYVRKPFPREQEQTPEWITSMRGTHIFLRDPVLKKRLRQGVWRPLVEAFDRWNQRARIFQAANSQHTAGRAISAISQHCIDSQGPNTPWNWERLEFLTMLERCCRPRPEMINAYTSFINHAPEGFISSVRSGDWTSLLILLHWCNLFSKTEQWWLVDSARYESSRLIAHLSRHGNDYTKSVLNILQEAAAEEDADDEAE